MADKKRKYGPISKGMRLTIVVEDVMNDVLVVILEHGTKVFRGVLLDAKKRKLPPGICTAFGDQMTAEKAELGDNSQSCEFGTGPQTDVDISALAYRHTYNTDLSRFGQQFQGPPDRNFRRLGAGKSTRNIRLRPRQTLCSKCKSTCLDSDKGPIPINSSVRSMTQQNQSNSRQQTNLPPTTRFGISRNDVKKRQHDSRFDTRPKPTKLIKIENPTSKFTKTSPFIKISIGESTVMNIPPRIHESDKEELSSEEKCTTDVEDNITNVESHDCVVNDSDDSKSESKCKHKKSLRKSKERRSLEDDKRKENVTFHHKKHKKSRHKHKEFDSDNPCPIIITENIDSDDNDDKSENSEPHQIEVVRPRLLYTWRQNKGLSPRHDSHSNNKGERSGSTIPLSPKRENQSSHLTDIQKNSQQETNNKNGTRKEYKLRSRSRSVESNPEYEITEDSAYISYEDPKSVSDRSEGCSTEADTSSETDSSDYGDGPPGDENMEAFRPLLMKIHTNTVAKCVTTDGRKIHNDDIVWGKIKGFPWWPGRVLSIAVSQRDNGVVLRQIAQIAWFGSSTMSYIQCSDLFPFLEDFKLRYKRKKRGPYKVAIKQATIAAQSCSAQSTIDIEDIDV